MDPHAMRTQLGLFMESLSNHPGIPAVLFITALAAIAALGAERPWWQTALIVPVFILPFWAMVFVTAWTGRHQYDETEDSANE